LTANAFGHDKGFECQGVAGERDVEGGDGTTGDGVVLHQCIEADVADLDALGAGGNGGKGVAAVGAAIGDDRVRSTRTMALGRDLPMAASETRPTIVPVVWAKAAAGRMAAARSNAER